MSNYNTSANIILTVNGKQAQKMMTALEKDAKRLEKQIAKAATAGDKASLKKLQRELNTTRKAMDQLKGTAFSVENVLHNLDKATPKELNRTLKQLQQELNGIQRGSAAWDAHTAKIRAVKAELSRINSTLATQQSWWTRMNNWLNNCQTALLGLGAAITGMVMAGRKAVNAYAEMDEQLANTRKYTGMSEENVNKLNEAFRRMDTRTPRARLNELAQEAGRLGKNTLESVQGYVEAADIINVALVDLGEGATQTIAKLTNIFGVEEMLGTKEAMLAVGSTVNVLSQNCTASKPYLVEFAQRMAGIGSQAGLTIPEILAFGAVLDANGQKVEMSSTAIQKVIMNLANKNHEFAATLGLDAAKLNETLKHSAKDGLLMFLEALQNMGKDVGFENATMTLAPALSDMGLDAARVSQVLSTLAMHLDEVKWQMGEAEKAFNEASSATHEYEIFNNTAQASIDKAKKRVNELAITLGEKLYPIMKHIYTSSGIFLRVLNMLVDFVIKYLGEIFALTATIIAYNVAVNLAAIKTKALATWQALSKATTVAWTVATRAAAVVTALFSGNLHRASVAFKALSRAMHINPFGLVVAAVTAVVATLALFVKRTSEAAQVQKMLNNIKDDAKTKLIEEKDKIELLIEAANNEKLAMDKRKEAVDKLNKIIPNYNAQIDETTGKYNASKEALDKYLESLQRKYEIEGAKEQLATLGKERAGLIMERDEVQKQINEERARYAQDSSPNVVTSGGAYAPTAYHSAVGHSGEIQGLIAKRDSINAKIAANKSKKDSLLGVYGNDLQQVAVEEISTTTTTTTTTTIETSDPIVPPGGDNPTSDRFAKEKEWREHEEALARIAYATGKTDYIAHTKKMDEIAVQFYEKQLQHTDLTEAERTKIQADYEEARKKQRDNDAKATLDDETKRYNKELADLKQFYIDGNISKETFDLKTEEAEIKHQQKLVSLAEEGSKERLQAEQRLQSLLMAQMKRRQQETEKLESKYASLKKDYFGENPQERQAKLDADLAALKIVYDREIAATGDNAEEKLRIEEAFEKAKLALRKKYNLLAEEDTRNSMERAVADSMEWLEGDGGKALSGAMDTLVSGMSAVFSQLSSLMQAELEMQTAAIEKRYDAEISRAEGNSYQVKKLEKQKEKEIAKAKNEANKKMFAMQVIQAVAQTATNALSAYGSAAAVPVIGYILAPIAAAMAVAAGAIQIAAIKKQQQASEAQGYSEGGFTPSGRVDEPVGIVHAGEWVASQKLVNNPQIRPLLNALDYAQRTNTIGSLRMSDVSKSITAPMRQAQQPQDRSKSEPVVIVQNSEYVETMQRLAKRLNEPFVTVNTVTGDHGIQRAEEEYDRLMKNKSPKTYK